MQTIERTQKAERGVFVPVLRIFLKKDLERVAEIEAIAFDSPWTVQEFQQVLKNPNVCALVAEVRGDVAGFVFYELRRVARSKRLTIELLDLAVAPHIRGRGIGWILTRHVQSRCGDAGDCIRANVAESSVDAQLFLKRLGFRCMKIIPRFYPNGQTAYRFSWRCKG
jgi:ribosomal protein S18 acetylase RimI-like enzyme